MTTKDCNILASINAAQVMDDVSEVSSSDEEDVSRNAEGRCRKAARLQEERQENGNIRGSRDNVLE